MNRRSFLKSVSVFGLGSLTGLASSPAPARRFKIGHTGITWGYKPENAPAAIQDVAAAGYHGFESFGHVLEYWETRGGLGQFLEPARLPLISAYCPTVLADPAKRPAELQKLVRWGKLIKQCGGRVAVIGPENVKRTEYDFAAVRPHIVAALNDYGRALSDVGILGALHPHTGSSVQTRDEVYAVYEATDPRYAKMAPDLGELLHGGADPLEVIRDFRPVIVHAHLKDWIGGQFNDGYCPAGQGKVDLAGCTAALERGGDDLMLMGELNPDPKNPKPPAQLIGESRRYFESLGYTFLSP